MPRTLHVIGLPHTETTPDYPFCAFTSELMRFIPMMRDLGYKVNLYAGVNNEVGCDDHIPVVTEAEREEWFGAIDWSTTDVPVWDAEAEWWHVMNARVVSRITERLTGDDIVCLSAGIGQASIHQRIGLDKAVVCEPFVGYDGILTDRCAFRSHAWRHYLYGKYGIGQGRNFDTVIPAFYDPTEFAQPDITNVGTNLLFVGRQKDDKGIHEAIDLAKRTGRKLVIAGQGTPPNREQRRDQQKAGYDLEYIGVVNPAERNALMREAAAVVMPTRYIEPFGLVAVEAQLNGCPVICPDYAAFPETVIHGVTGFRCSSMGEMEWAVDHLHELTDTDRIASSAALRFGVATVGPVFDAWFTHLATLRGAGYYAPFAPPAP